MAKKFTISARLSVTVSLLFSLLFSLPNSNASAALTVSKKHILVYGDSLSAAYGMDEKNGWVSLLTTTLNDTHIISNASISGETSSGGLARLRLTLDELTPDLVILELGANDGLRGYQTSLLKQNLAKMIESIQSANAAVILASISLPPTYGPRYIDQFRAVFTDLAKEYQIPLLDLYQPSFVETPGYLQADGLHPTEITQPIIRDLVIDFLTDNQLLEP